MSDLDLINKITFLPEEAKEEVAKYIDLISAKYPRVPKIPLKFGMMKGTFKMADDFDEPLDEFKDYM